MGNARSPHVCLDEAARRRLAIQLAGQMPASREDSLAVLAHLRIMVDYATPDERGSDPVRALKLVPSRDDGVGPGSGRH